MDGGMLAGFIVVGMLGIANIVAVAFTFGRLKQKVEDLCARVTRLEVIQNGKSRRVEVKGGV